MRVGSVEMLRFLTTKPAITPALKFSLPETFGSDPSC
jgi:hypothetical protein